MRSANILVFWLNKAIFYIFLFLCFSEKLKFSDKFCAIHKNLIFLKKYIDKKQKILYYCIYMLLIFLWGCDNKLENPFIKLENVYKTYGDAEVLKELNLSIMQKQFVTLLGPSGCGKTTTLRIIGGFESPTEGRVYMNGKDITLLPPYLRNVNTVFQKYALFPHMNVFENVAFGLKVKKFPKPEIEKRVSEMLELVNLPGIEKRSIDSLSGGQQQRVAIARSLVTHPDVLLLDEPLGALDLKLRKEMQLELKNIQQRLGITFIYVTHDQEEALTMSDQIVVMNNGYIQQIGSPIDIYNEPENAFVADFIGASIIVPGIMHKDCDVEFCGQHFECVDVGFAPMEEVDVVIRPEDLKIVPVSEGLMTGVVKSVLFKGVHYEMVVEANGTDWLIHSTLHENAGDTVGLKIAPFDIHIMEKYRPDPILNSATAEADAQEE